MTALQQYLDLYASQRELLERGACAPLNAHRSEALKVLQAKGLPTGKTENYLYTDVEAALAPDYGVNLARVAVAVDTEKMFRCQVTDMEADAIYVKGDSVTAAPLLLEEGVVVARMADFEQMELAGGKKGGDLLAAHYHRLAQAHDDAIVALNTLLVQEGIVIYVPDGVQHERPLQIVNVSVGKVDMMWNRRVLVLMGKGSSATLISCEEAPTLKSSLALQTTEVVLAEGASLKYYSLEETSSRHTRFHQCFFELAAKAVVEYGEMTLHSGRTRNTIMAHLLGDEAQFNAYGAVIADRQERVDNHILVDHQGQRGTSDMLYKYVMEGESMGAFAGKVLVREGAQKTASEQTNANLCVGKEARVFSQPMLEIYADDVKCNHGSTIGKLDMNALLYMRQRGIPLKEARLLLQHAFVNDVLQRVSVAPLRSRLSELVDMRFRTHQSNCRTCQLSDKCH